MSGHGNRDITGLRFSLGSLVAFTWRPEGFWVFQNDGLDPFKPRMDRLINRFENNNYPDREGMADELKADSRFEEKDRISTSDHLIKTWPPYERPVAPAFGVAATEKNQDPKEKEGKFSGKKITGTLKHKLPKNLASYELAYPEEVKTDWFLHTPEHLVYLPEEGEKVEHRLDRMVQHYILQYTNELRNNAPFLTPLRGEYSPAAWIADFCKRAGELNHDSGLYPEDYRTGEERINKTRQFPCFFNFWWYGENLQLNSFNPQGTSSTEETAQQISRSVVNAWIGSPPHYANMTNLDSLEYKDLALLDVGRSGDYYSQVFMGAPLWLLSGCCTWQGTEPWQVLSWKTYENNRYKEPFGGEIYFKGKLLYKQETLIGAAIQQQGETYYLLIVTLNSQTIKVLEVEFPFLKTVTHDDFQEVCSYQHENELTKLQSFFFSTNGTKGITILREFFNPENKFVVRYENRQFAISNATISSSSVYAPPNYHFFTGSGYPTTLIYSLQEYSGSSNTVVSVDYFDNEFLLTNQLSVHSKDEFTSNYPNIGVPLITTELIERNSSSSYSLNNLNLLGSGSSSSYYWYHPGTPGSTFTEIKTETGPTDLRFIDLRKSVYIIDNQLFIDGQTISLPFTHIYTRQNIDGPGIYPIFPNLINNYDYFYKHLLGCSYVRYENEWIFSAVGYEIDYEISEDYELAIEVTSSTPVKYFLSSNPEITTLLNSLEKPFLVSVI